MNRRRLKEHPRFFAVLALLTLVAGVGGWRVQERLRTVRSAKERLAELDREWRAQSWGTGAALVDRAAELAQVSQELAPLDSMAKGISPDDEGWPKNRAEAFFAMARFIEDMRERAADHGVAVAADERFGFAEYAHSGPAAGEIDGVFRERLIAERLLVATFEAGPARFIGLQRERFGRGASGHGEQADDYFDYVGKDAARGGERGEARAFRMTFEGRTESLRALLNRLAKEEAFVVVRSVEAERVAANEPGQGRDHETPVRLVPDRDTRFTVVVECWPNGGAIAQVTVPDWQAPPAQRRGVEWIFEIFAPPDVVFDASSERFSVAIPPALPVAMAAPVTAAAQMEAFAMELVEVQRVPFRLQLIGFAGDEGAFRGLFEDLETGETFFANSSRHVPGLGVHIERVAIERVAVPLAESMTTHRRAALARVRDERSGEVVQLSSLERKFTSEPVAVVSLRDGAERRAVRQGEAIEIRGEIYRIDRIQTTPPALEVSCESPGPGGSERRTLTARRNESPPPPPAS